MDSAFFDLDFLACAIAVTDKDGKICHCNQQLADLTGHSVLKLLQARLWDIVPNETRIFLQTHVIPSILHDQSVSEVYVRLRNADGARVPVLLNTRQIMNAGVEYFSWAVIIAQNRDTLERKIIAARSNAERDAENLSKASIELKRSNDALENFAYVASHDLKAPLQNIKQLLEFIEEDAGSKLDGSSLGFLTLAQDKTGVLTTLIDDLLAYSRTGTDHGGFSKVNVRDFVCGIHSLSNLGKAFDLEYVGDTGLEIETLTVPLQLVVRNLLNNAIKHHDQPTGRLRFSCEETNGNYEMMVSDDGPGINDIYYGKIFEMFKKLEIGDSNRGSGMGLALVKRTLETYGSNIFVSSNNPRGAQFSFDWPKSETLQRMITVG